MKNTIEIISEADEAIAAPAMPWPAGQLAENQHVVQYDVRQYHDDRVQRQRFRIRDADEERRNIIATNAKKNPNTRQFV